MHFGLFSNGFRPHRSAGSSYDEDIAEIVLAEELGFRDVFVSEHHGESSHIGAVDTIPAPELLICKAAALTKRIRMGAAVKLIHLHHPLDVAIQAAVTSHLVGPGRFIFGYGTGFAAPLFCDERGLSFEDRQDRLLESLDIILKCWSTDRPFDLDGRFWRGRGLLALPKPADGKGLPMATATSFEPTLRLAAERGYTLLASYHEAPSAVRARGDRYAAHASAAGIKSPRRNLSVARAIYVGTNREEAIEDLRDAVTYEVGIQARRGFLTMLKTQHGLDVPNDARAIGPSRRGRHLYRRKPRRGDATLDQLLCRDRRIRNSSSGRRQGLGDTRATPQIDADVHERGCAETEDFGSGSRRSAA